MKTLTLTLSTIALLASAAPAAQASKLKPAKDYRCTAASVHKHKDGVGTSCEAELLPRYR
jgi:uncharacterized membrane protein